MQSVGLVLAFWRYDSAMMGQRGLEVLVQQAAVFFCTITCIIVLWITSIAGDNRQAAKRSAWHRTPASLWEAVWIISRLPADCLWGWGVGGGGGVRHGWAGVWGISVGSFSALTQSASVGGTHSTFKMASVSHSRWPSSFCSARFQFLLKFRSQTHTFDRPHKRCLGPWWPL